MENPRSVSGHTVRRAYWRIAVGSTVLAAVLASAPLAAQRRQTQAAGTNQNAPAGVSPQEFDQLFNSFVAMQAQQELQLRDDQYAPFVVRLRALQDTRRRAQNQRNRVFQELRRLIQSSNRGETVDDTLIKDQMKSLDEVETRSAGEIRQAQTNLDQMLDARQQARFRLLEDRVERQKIDLLMRVRQGNGRQGPARGQSGNTPADRF